MNPATVILHLASLGELARIPAGARPRGERERPSANVSAARRRRGEASRLLVRTAAGPGSSVSVSHDSEFVVLAVSRTTCGVDIEDHPEPLLAEVAHRFCAPGELGAGGARMLWAAKESAAKATGRGLRAGLRSISFDGGPGDRWTSVRWPYGEGFLSWTKNLGDRHFALTVRAPHPPATGVHTWSPVSDGRRWWFAPQPHPPARLAALAGRLSGKDIRK